MCASASPYFRGDAVTDAGQLAPRDVERAVEAGDLGVDRGFGELDLAHRQVLALEHVDRPQREPR
jgi:hypothetical protein